MNSEKKGSNTTKGNKMYPWFYAVCLAFMPTHERGGGGQRWDLYCSDSSKISKGVRRILQKECVFESDTGWDNIFWRVRATQDETIRKKKRTFHISIFLQLIFLLPIVRSNNEKNVKWLASMLGLLPILWLSYMLLYF